MSYKQDIADYYKQTQDHYKIWWKLDKGLSLHYGLWEEGTNDFVTALGNTNKKMAALAKVTEGAKVLDAGCGVGGAAIYLAKNLKANCIGITLSEEQKVDAIRYASENNVSSLVDFQIQDYLNTTFEDNTFDVVWACESMTSAPSKYEFLQEASRILKPGGRIVVSDYFLAESVKREEHKIILDWEKSWALGPMCSVHELETFGKDFNLKLTKNKNFSEQILPSAKRMYKSYLYGLLPSEIYNLIHPKVSRFAKHHYKSGLYQYKALKKGLWQHHMVVFTKL
jgi:tocopherol O-methyltransferase